MKEYRLFKVMRGRRHKWNGLNIRVKGTSNNGGFAVACARCGMIREYVKGIPTYFLNDVVYDRYAPECKPDSTLK